jgi:hypothetical protein
MDTLFCRDGWKWTAKHFRRRFVDQGRTLRGKIERQAKQMTRLVKSGRDKSKHIHKLQAELAMFRVTMRDCADTAAGGGDAAMRWAELWKFKAKAYRAHSNRMTERVCDAMDSLLKQSKRIEAVEAERDKLQAALDAAYVARADALREAHEAREQVRRLREEITQMPDRACDTIKDSWNYQKEFNDGATIDDLTDAILDEFYQDTCDQYGALRATAPSDGGSEGKGRNG